MIVVGPLFAPRVVMLLGGLIVGCIGLLFVRVRD
jgi:hypothetical protein